MTTPITPTVLLIRDGWGFNPHSEHDQFNAVHLARTPIADALASDWPSVLIRTSGEDVGLPVGPKGPVMGNSEVGHQNLGAGRIVDQELMRITRSIQSGEFFENAALDDAFGHAQSTGNRIHLIGLVSEGQVHSDLDHLYALIQYARRRGVPRDGLVVHAITDGRDTPPNAGKGYLAHVEKALSDSNFRPIASIMGRYWAMDRDHRWDRIERAYHCLVEPSQTNFLSAENALTHCYQNPENENQKGDEFVAPIAIGNEEAIRDSRVQDGDSIVFFNFRGDRPREISRAFILNDAEWANVTGGGFKRSRQLRNIRFTSLTRYEEGLPVEVAFDKPTPMPNILGETISQAGLTQFRCAETEKFPHVTFFFNDYREDPFQGENRVIIPSPKDVPTYDLKPEMSAAGVRDAVLSRLHDENCEPLIVVNFANGDMVGHTGVLQAAIDACETVDACVGEIQQATLALGGSLIITADHGNAEQMWDPENNCPHTSHTNYEVPLHIVGAPLKGATLRHGGRLADVAPTLLELMSLAAPDAMTGTSLLK